jgi:hypothetical protein
MRSYFGLARATNLSVTVELDDDVAFSERVLRIVRDQLQDAGLTIHTVVDDPGFARSYLHIHVEGERRNSRLNSYGRARLLVRYSTGPGRTIEETVELLGPFRLSRVSASDAVINSLLAIESQVFRTVLLSLDKAWQRDLVTDGLSYFVAEMPEGDPSVDVQHVLDHLTVPVDGNRRRGFDTPPMIARELQRYLVGSPYGFSLNPLTGEIRIVYNDST